jgi:gamma-glutamyltranspeptidase/glutathione hydrolase
MLLFSVSELYPLMSYFRRARTLVFFSVIATNMVSWNAAALAAGQQDPEAATGIIRKQQVSAKEFLVVSANPYATEAGYQMLRQGGSAVDAAIAVQLVLGLVEPQSSGIGGGLFMLAWQDKTKTLHTLDGRETAPAAAMPDWFVQNGKLLSWPQAFVGGKAVGTPGVIASLAQSHQKFGKLAWADLFKPAILLAEQGFKVSPRLHMLLAGSQHPGLKQFSSSREYFFPDGKPLPIGFVRKNPAYAALLTLIAAKGPEAFYQGENAKAILQTVNQASINPGAMTLADISGYQPVWRDPVCAPYRSYKVCGMAPPSSGSIAVLQMLGILHQFDLSKLKPESVEAVHLISQASRLAFADRERYAADPAFSPVPVQGLLATDYLKQRAAQIDLKADNGQITAGVPEGAVPLGEAKAPEYANTSHLSVVDKEGNAVSMTTSIENAFGSGLMVNGYLLNNQLTDFSLQARDKGLWVANRVEAGKRPRSSMAPMLVFNQQGQLQMIAGSPGGSRIINYVAQSLIAMIDWQMGPQQAADLPKFTHRNDVLAIEAGTPLVHLSGKLQEMGYQVRTGELNSGLHLIKRAGAEWQAGADPRREGMAKGL